MPGTGKGTLFGKGEKRQKSTPLPLIVVQHEQKLKPTTTTTLFLRSQS